MSQFLKKSTAVRVRIGPVVSATDGVTPTTVALNTADQAELIKHNGADASVVTDISAGTLAAISGASGWYDLTLTDSWTDTVGPLDVIIQDASQCLPIWRQYTVLPEATYDALVAGTGAGLRADLTGIESSTALLAKFADAVGANVVGTVYDDGATYAASSTIFYSDDVNDATADLYNGRFLIMLSGGYAKKATKITDYAKVSDYGKFTVEDMGAAVSNNDTFLIL